MTRQQWLETLDVGAQIDLTFYGIGHGESERCQGVVVEADAQRLGVRWNYYGAHSGTLYFRRAQGGIGWPPGLMVTLDPRNVEGSNE